MKIKFILILIIFLLGKPIYAQTNDAYVGEVRLFAFGFEPKGWASCDGRLLPISQNIALFSIIGTTYGGNGTSNFALPNLNGRMAVGAGQGQGMDVVELGEQSDNQTVTLSQDNLPQHTHTISIKANSSAGTLSIPTSTSSIAAPVQNFNSNTRPVSGYNLTTPNIALKNITIAPVGNSTPVSTLQPVLTANYCIALQGIFPPRP